MSVLKSSVRCRVELYGKYRVSDGRCSGVSVSKSLGWCRLSPRFADCANCNGWSPFATRSRLMLSLSISVVRRKRFASEFLKDVFMARDRDRNGAGTARAAFTRSAATLE